MIVMEARVTDSTHLELAQAIDTPPGGKVVVSVADPTRDGKELEEWAPLSIEGLASAYAESEPEYSAGMLKEPNPEYEG